eukprot:6470698-Amphidinium_carterae.1
MAFVHWGTRSTSTNARGENLSNLNDHEGHSGQKDCLNASEFSVHANSEVGLTLVKGKRCVLKRAKVLHESPEQVLVTIHFNREIRMVQMGCTSQTIDECKNLVTRRTAVLPMGDDHLSPCLPPHHSHLLHRKVIHNKPGSSLPLPFGGGEELANLKL